jgi:rod shape-determining protein MreC
MKSRLNIIGGIVFVVLLVAVLVIGSNQQSVRKLQAGFLSIISPFLKSGSEIDRRVKGFREGMKKLDELEVEVDRLKKLNSKLVAERRDQDELQNKINQLTEALKYRQQAPFELLPARVIARDASTWYNNIIIDRGSAEGIDTDKPVAVITEAGLVGKTTAVSEHSSIVVLIADEGCKVAAKIRGSKEQGIVKGERASSSLMPTISLNYLSKTAALENNAEFLTSGVGGVFPAGIKIGYVHDFKVRELDGYATVIPAVDLTTLEDVFVVTSTTARPALVERP